MISRIAQSLAGIFSPGRRALPPINPAGEGNYHPGPYTVSGGWLPSSWGQFLNFWQMDLDPLPVPGCSTVEACVWAYIRAIAQLPGYHNTQEKDGAVEAVNTSALSRILRAPNTYQTPSDFLVHLIRSLLLTGNSYWPCERNERNEVTALHWTDPRNCHVRTVGIEGQAFAEVFYEISENPLLDDFQRRIGRSLIIPARDVLHIKLACPRHPLIGETWLQALWHELANRNAMNSSASAFFNNAARPSGVLLTDAELTKAQLEELRNRWNEQSRGAGAGGTPILTHGLKWQATSISQEDSQVVEQLKLNDRAIAAVFGVPAVLLGITDTATQKSAEAVMTEWLASGLGWLIDHIERAFDQFFGLDRIAEGREWTEYDTRALLRSLYTERIDGLVRGVQGGIYSPNEARALEGYGAVEAGDEPRVQQQVVPLSFAVDPPAPPVPPAPPAPPEDEEPPEDEDDEEPAEDEGKGVSEDEWYDRLAA
jgi:HK97 family phage portal protein